jgi:myo-inositol-1(or 4)-monophosphatase
MRGFVEELSIVAGELAMQYRSGLDALAVEHKTERDLVTEADHAVEALIISRIRERYPTHAVIGEETGEHAGSDCRWIIDPIDGTASFVHGQPYFSISIAVEHDGVLVLGAVNAPALGERFIAERGAGAWCNGRRLRVSQRATLAESMLATGFACIRGGLPRNNLPYLNALLPRIRDLRRYGSAAVDLCYVAAGRIEGFWELNLNSYDVAAGFLMVEEAGGCWGDFRGDSENLYAEILATNGLIQDELMAALAAADG